MGSAGVRCSSELAEASASGAESESHGSAWDEVWAPSRVDLTPTGMAPVTWRRVGSTSAPEAGASSSVPGSTLVRAEARE